MKKILEEKIALVTGAGTGIGRAIAKRFVEEGAQVFIIGCDEQPLRETSHWIGKGCHFKVCDISKKQQFEEIINSIPHLDILVNNAGICPYVDLLSEDFFQTCNKTIDINMMGSLYGCRAAGKKFVSQGKGGRIINISSILASLAYIGSIHYGMSKAAISQMTRSFATEWASHNILVNAIAPGYVDTAMCKDDYTDFFKEFYIENRRIPLARVGQPEEVAEACLFLANPKNTYMTGHVLVIDGGLSATF